MPTASIGATVIVDTIFQASMLARQAIIWAAAPHQILGHHAPVGVTHTDAGCATQRDVTSQWRTVGLHFECRTTAGQRERERERERNMSLILKPCVDVVHRLEKRNEW